MPSPTSFHFLQDVRAYIQRENLVHRGDHVLVAVSGGPDSVALLDVLHSLREALGITQLTALHFNHHLRGKDSEEDQAFVEDFTHRLEVPLLCGEEDVQAYQQRHRVSLEMAARDCRHSFFYETQGQLRAQRIALGHTANDQAEEILLRLLRGTGPSGMAGMLPCTPGGIIRPLLCVTHREILEYLATRGLPHRDDASNAEPFCQRNRVRLEVFPLLEAAFHSQIVGTLTRHARLARDEEDYWQQHLRNIWPTLCQEETASRVILSLPHLTALHSAEQKRIFRFALSKIRGNLLRIYAIHLESLVQWLPKSFSGKSIDLPERVRVIREGDTLVFTREPSAAHEIDSSLQDTILSQPGIYDFPSFHVEISLENRKTLTAQAEPPVGATSVWLDADKVRWPLILRAWRPGDRFCPSGMGGSKKLQDFFVDRKIPREQRKHVLLLCDMEKICWIVGHRLDERVRVRHHTRRVLIATQHIQEKGVVIKE